MSTAIKFDPNNPPKTLAESLAMLQKLQTELDGKAATLTAKESELSTALTSALALCAKENPPKTLSEALTAIAPLVEKAKQAVEPAPDARAAAETIRTLSDQVKTLSEGMKGLQQENRRLHFTEVAKEFVGDRQGHVDMLEFLFTSDPKGFEGDRYKKYVEGQKSSAQALKASGLFKELGADGGAQKSATEQLEEKAKQLSETSKATNAPLSFEQAMVQVCNENPQLYSAHVSEQTRGGVGA